MTAALTAPLEVWHGTRRALGALDVAEAIARDGVAAQGVGLYFTSSLADAIAYALPQGFVWRCTLDAAALERGLQQMVHGDGITHYLLTDPTALLTQTCHTLTQHPERKLNHRARKAAVVDPKAHGLTFVPELPAAARI